MLRNLYVYFILFLTFGQKQVSSKVTYGLEQAIEDISYFVPGAKIVLTTALKVAYAYAEIQQLIDPSATELLESLDLLNDKVDALTAQLNDMTIQLNSISDDVKDVKNTLKEQVIKHVPMEVDLISQIRSVHTKINTINGLFDDFLLIRKSPHTFENYTLLNFANSITDLHNGVEHSLLRQIFYDITEKYSHANILQGLADHRLSKTMMCKNNPPASSMQKIVDLYHDIMLAEIKGMILTEFAYSVKKKFEQNTEYTTELEIARLSSYNRTISTIIEVKRTLYQASRDFRRCDPIEHEEGFTHAKVGPIFQAYFIREQDIGDPAYLRKTVPSCSGTCGDRKDSPDLCRSDDCHKMGRSCTGMLHDCKSTDNRITICLASNDSISRYQYVEYKENGDIFGQKHTCRKEQEVSLRTKASHNMPFHIAYIAPECEVCLCTCENLKIEIDRFFNLQDVTSDVQSNKIITGARFRKANNIFHIQIQEGVLGKNADIKKDTVQWKPINTFTINDESIVAGRDYHNITYNERTIFLDNIDSPHENVLTGLRFQLQDNNLRFEIQVTPFNFFSGELKITESRWLSNTKSIDERTEIDINDCSLPTSSFLNSENSNNDQYIRFTTSSLKTDVGQSVVPFIDLQEISSDPPLPLSGAGLIHRGNKESAGFLTLQLRTYYFAPHLHA